MKVLRWSCNIADLDILIGGKLQESFQMRVGMVGTLSLAAVWQQKN